MTHYPFANFKVRMTIDIVPFFGPVTATWSYLIVEPGTRQAAIVDPVVDFDLAAGRTGADRLLPAVRERSLHVALILQVQAYADHLTAAACMKVQLGAAVIIGAGSGKVQQTFARVFKLGDGFAVDGSRFDRLVGDGDTLPLADATFRVSTTACHSNDGVSDPIGDAVFVDGAAAAGCRQCALQRSRWRRGYVVRIGAHGVRAGGATGVFVCHDCPPARCEAPCQTPVGAQRSGNIHLRDDVDPDAFVRMRSLPDAILPMPQRLLPSMQVDIRAGQLPPAQENGVSYLKLPLNYVVRPA
ncbi:MAG: MBL fold metallo-hydrolase [Immundisolibacter sp.]